MVLLKSGYLGSYERCLESVLDNYIYIYSCIHLYVHVCVYIYIICVYEYIYIYIYMCVYNMYIINNK